MFNRLKEAAQEAKNKFAEATESEDVENGQFQCPICMRKFNDPEKLIAHHTQCQISMSDQVPSQPIPPRSQPHTSSNGSPPINELELQIETLQKEKKDLWQEISKLKSELENTNKELKASEITNDQLLKRKTELFQENETFKNQITLQATDIEKMTTEKSDLEITNENLHNQIAIKDSKIVEFEENEKTSIKKYEYLSELYETEMGKSNRIEVEIAERNEKINSLENEVSKYRTMYENELEKGEQFLANQTKDSDGLMDAVMKAEDQVRILRVQLQNSEKSFNIEKEKTEYLSRELKITTSKLQKLDDHQQGIENTNQKLLKEFSNNETKCITYQKSVEELNDQLSSLTKDFDDYKQANNYEFEIEKLLSEKETLCRQLEDAYNCKNRNAELESVLMAAQKSNSDLEEEKLRLQEKLNQEIKSKNELMDANVSSESVINEMISEREILERNLESIKIQNQKMEAEIKTLKAKINTIMKESELFKTKKQDEYQQLTQKLNKTTTDLTQNKSNIENWKSRYASASQKVVELESQYTKAVGELDSLKPKLYEAEKSRTSMAAEVETLTKTRDNLLTQSERLVIQTTKLEKEIVEHRQQINSNKNTIQQLEKLKQSAIERENEKHEELQLQKTKVEKLKKDFNVLQSEKKSRIIEIQQQEDLRHVAEAKIDKLENEMKSLRIQNQNYLKEKASTTSEVDQMKAQYVEIEEANRNISEKMSEAQATINELGRRLAETQIAWENEKSRRWVEDDSVDSCQKCRDPFTMLVRRHHCRKCGGIFCYNCSNFTLILPSSSKPQRVCETCCQS